MPHSIEPIQARQIVRWMMRRGCKLVNQSGSHQKWKTPEGTSVHVPDPGGNHPVTSKVAKRIAVAFDMNLLDLREEVRRGS